jgi:hypothetical protein
MHVRTSFQPFTSPTQRVAARAHDQGQTKGTQETRQNHPAGSGLKLLVAQGHMRGDSRRTAALLLALVSNIDTLPFAWVWPAQPLITRDTQPDTSVAAIMRYQQPSKQRLLVIP